jgi:septin family protein
MDNLNTPTAASLYEGFPSEEAKGTKDKLEFQYTSKHGSWLNMAEMEMSVLNRQRLPRWIPRMDRMRKEAVAWNLKRNQEACKINRQFSTADASIKLKRVYRKFES